jgi:hypothetical protein
MKFFTVVLLLLGNLAYADSCLNISGTYESAALDQIPLCAPSRQIMKQWSKYEQSDCQSITISRAYKLDDGTFCESQDMVRRVADVWTPSKNPLFNYKFAMLSDRFTLDFMNVRTSFSWTETMSLDAQGNLVNDDSNGGTRLVLKRSPVN